jgi:hypothetical protein
VDDLERARRWAADFASRFPEVIEAYLIGVGQVEELLRIPTTT